MFEIWTALGIGIAGSLHCVGMCGPIALALPPGPSRLSRVLGRLLYSVGRAATYAVLGGVAGGIGHAISIAGWQRGLSVTAGALLLFVFVTPKKWRAGVGSRVSSFWTNSALGQVWGKLLTKNSMLALFLIGLLNGLLPCGLVYVALAGALVTGTALNGAMFMFLFGLGTLPALLAVSLFGSFVGQRLRGGLRRLLPVGGALLAVLIILRGMSLGIPYVSPKLNPMHGQTGEQTTVECH